MQWTTKDSSQLYAVNEWGAGYFGIDNAGNVVLYPKRDNQSAQLNLHQLVNEIVDFGLKAPVLIRFEDILSDRVHALCDAFDQASKQHNYKGGYTAVYPIKVNQQRYVVEQVVHAAPGRVGLEAGSKPELMAVLAQAFADSEQGQRETIICNGYKDTEYVRLALIGSQLGMQVIIVVEQPAELDIVIRESKALGIEPVIGVRVRLASIAKGRWQNTGGEQGKFGLSAHQLLQVIDRLQSEGYLQALQLLHFHVGSQVSLLSDIKNAITEAAQFYAELHRLGVPINIVDVGGGLGVDYEGSKSASEFSMSYAVQDYANCIVNALAQCCEKHKLPQPHIITESGRALTAHHAVLVTNVVDVEHVHKHANDIETGVNLVEPLKALHGIYEDTQNIESFDCAESHLQKAEELFQKMQAEYIAAKITLQHRAIGESIYLEICHLIQNQLQVMKPDSELLEKLNKKLADKYFCNFSIFQSLPDIWGLGQHFPIMPLHRLNEYPGVKAVLHDLTCDSDGQVKAYVQQQGISSTLSLHQPSRAEPYYLGIFLVGAYQEILGDMHNLFGDTNTINVVFDRNGQYHLEQPEPGDRVDELLRYVHYDPDALLKSYHHKLQELELEESVCNAYFDELKEGLLGYTYLED